MVAVGNDKINEIYESNLPADYVRPEAISPREMKDDFIHKKYVKRTFISTFCLYENNYSEHRSENKFTV